jgi:hypothetical protein
MEGGHGHAHLLVPRFDQPLSTRLHQHTLGGLLHVDYHDVGASSYLTPAYDVTFAKGAAWTSSHQMRLAD